MKILIRMVAYQPLLWIANLAVMIIFMLLIQGQALVIQAFFNHLTGDQAVRLNIWALVALLFAIRLARNTGQVLDVITSVQFSAKITALLRGNMLRHIVQESGTLPGSPAEATSRFRGDAAEIPGFLIWLNKVIGMAVFLSVALWTMLHISVTVTIAALLPFVVITAIARSSAQRLQEYRRASRQATGSVVGFIGEIFGAVQAIQVANTEAGVLRRFADLNDQRRQVALRDRLFNEIIQSISQNAVNIATGLILILSSQLIRQGRFTVAEFALFIYYLEQLGFFIGQFSLVLARYRQIGVAEERMHTLAPDTVLTAPVPFNLLEIPPRLPLVTHQPSDQLNSLEVRRLSYQYPNRERGIDNISFRLARGQVLAITGKIGAGKTTLLRVLLGLLPRSSGEILWNDQLIQEPYCFFVPPRAAYLPQVPRLFSDTLRENILLGLPENTEQVMNALHTAVFDPDLAQLPDHLNTFVGAKGVKLSGGQIQRIAAARTFIRQPELFVFDDLSSALDGQTEQQLWERLFQSHSVTCIVVTHRQWILDRADQVLILEDRHTANF